MNRSKLSVNNRLSKKIRKEVHNAQKEYLKPEERLYSDQLTTKEMLKKYPKKVAKVKIALLDSMDKGIKLKKKAPTRINSKRTTPAEGLIASAAPAYVHKEGSRWAKTLIVQSKIQRKSLQKKLSKKRR